LDQEQIAELLDALPANLESLVDRIAAAEGDNLTRADAASLIAAVKRILIGLDAADLRVLIGVDPFDRARGSSCRTF
jgi:hypothetical protein